MDPVFVQVYLCLVVHMDVKDVLMKSTNILSTAIFGTSEIEDDFIKLLMNPNVYGVTILGGEPMDQVRDNDLLNLVKRIKTETNQNIWIYSGYTYEEIIAHPKTRAIFSYCDVLVDGPFVENLKNLKLRFKGSSNQRIIDVQNIHEKWERLFIRNGLNKETDPAMILI